MFIALGDMFSANQITPQMLILYIEDEN